jgi:hypothetical protein
MFFGGLRVGDARPRYWALPWQCQGDLSRHAAIELPGAATQLELATSSSGSYKTL